MKNAIIIFIFLLFSFPTKAQTHYEEILRFENSRIKSIITYNSQNIKDGETVNYYPNGIIQSIIPYTNGKVNGIVESFYPNGLTESLGMIINNLQEGVFKYFHSNGRPKSKIVFSNGKPNLVSNCYDKKKNILYCGPFNMGNGEIYIYSENGDLIQKDHFKNGELIKSETVN